MPKKKHSRGDLSRRAFIKTATAATAAASVGIRPGSTHTEPEESAAASSFRTPWEINHKQIQTLWFNIWPKITALAWLNPVKQVSDASFSSTSISYRRAF
ncbi:MAG: twin-arginine translocation signal domain-containing protein, partial [Rhodothermales bacterium]